MEFFKRKCHLSIGQSGTEGFEIGGMESNGIPLHIKFSMEKADCESPNTAKITVWNLSPEHLAVLEKKDCAIILQAGYGENLSMAFMGTVTYATTTHEGADIMTDIEAADSRVELRDTSMSVSYAAGTATDIVYSNIAEKMGLPLSVSELAMATPTIFGNGFSFIGTAKDVMTRVTKLDGNNWTIQDGVIQITKPGEPISTECYVLGAESGLIGYPKRINISAGGSDGDNNTTTESDTAQLGWEVKYFINLAIGVNSYVYLESKMTTGYYRVQKVAIDGDNYEGDFQCTATLLEVKQQ